MNKNKWTSIRYEYSSTGMDIVVVEGIRHLDSQEHPLINTSKNSSTP